MMRTPLERFRRVFFGRSVVGVTLVVILAALMYLVIVGSVIAFWLYYWLVGNMDVTNTMLIALVTPVVAVILGMIVLHEQLNWRLVAGSGDGGAIMIGESAWPRPTSIISRPSRASNDGL